MPPATMGDGRRRAARPNRAPLSDRALAGKCFPARYRGAVIQSRVTRIPWWVLPVAIGLAVVAILTISVAADPARGVTSSGSPFADEASNAVNSRNLVLLGRWSTDGWNRYLVELPFSVILAVVFKLFGVGIVQARLLSIATAGLLVTGVGLGLRRAFGTAAAALAAIALGTSALVLYYGRLVYQEDPESLLLLVGVLALAVGDDTSPRRRGLVAGVLLALAIGTKPSAAFAVGGILAAVALAGYRSRAVRTAVVAAVAALAGCALVWLVVIWLPNRAAVADVMRIWPQFTWPGDPSALVARVARYVTSNDHALLLTLPLAAASATGLVATAAHRTALTGQARSLTAAAIGWLVGGLGILSIASYRPNRYVVPELPAAAILVAAGVCIVGPRLATRVERPGRIAIAAALAVCLAAPGLVADASWVIGAPASAPAIQAAMAPLVPPGAVVVGGDSPLFLMGAAVTTIIPWAGVPGNEGDLYHSAGARWFLTNGNMMPATVTVPGDAWAARRRVACATWFGTHDCLYQVP